MFRTYPVTNPVIRTDIYQGPDASLKEGGYVELGGEYSVHCCRKSCVDLVVAKAEVAGQGGINPYQLSDIVSVQERRNISRVHKLTCCHPNVKR